MKKLLTSVLAICLMGSCLQAYAFAEEEKAMVMDETSMEGYTIYHHPDMKAIVAKDGPLPILVFGNGGCSRSTSGYIPMINEIVNSGYIVIAVGTPAAPQPRPRPQGGQPQARPQAPQGGAPQGVDFANAGKEDNLIDAVDWICLNNGNPDSDYYHCADIFHIAVSGHSCGGAQALRVSYDPRVTTTILFNSGIGEMNMAGATPNVINELHAPLLYLIGGPEDVAYPNAAIDMKRIEGVPAVSANFPVGHGGTYSQPQGGVLAKIAIQWLDWQLKGKKEASKFFVDKKYREAQYPDCVYESKGL